MGTDKAQDQSRSNVTEAPLRSTLSQDEFEPFVALKRRLRQLSVDLWLWELGSLLLSATCVGVIIVILLRYDNKPLPNWAYGLTINGVISILAVVAKASMILPIAEAISQLKWQWFQKQHRPVLDFQYLDAASRGPWGCLTLLCRPSQWSIASMGALITIGALLMEPSLQLIPSYHPQRVTSGSSSLPKSVYYKDYQYNGPNVGTYFGATHRLGASTKEAFYGAIFTGAINESTSSTPVCATGNCTWPDFSSLGMCSSCTNLTSQLQYSAKDSSFTIAHSWYFPYGAFRQYEIRVGTFATSYAIPVTFTPRYNTTVNQTVLDMAYFNSHQLPDRSWTRPQAFECIMYFCVKTYAATMEQGVFKERVISTWPYLNETLPNEPHLSRIVASKPPAIQNYTLKPPDQDITYAVDSATMFLLKSWISSMLEQLSYFPGDLGGPGNSQDMAQFFYEAQKTTPGATSQLTGPAPVLARIADLMTTHIRNHGNPKLTVTGVSTITQTHVHARWWWSIFPVTLVFLTFAFMASTILLSMRNGIPVWKSSTLAVLVHDLGQETSDRINNMKLNALESNAQVHNMIMTFKNSKWRLKGV